MIIGRPFTDFLPLGDKLMYDPREHARSAAIISRRRKQVVRLEEQLVEVRQRLADDLLALERMQSRAIVMQEEDDGACNRSGKVLQQCRRRGKDKDACSRAGLNLKRCSS